jgi:nitroimidazol reductase NimA-like FMN-containing flavoprotein (pyridoxamine 5'-phosphate oxidase superfamily)/ribosomal protein S18 acetylase RimI-like enzyme
MDKPLPNLVEPGAASSPANLAGPRTQLKRHAERGSYARADVEAIIDEALLCHLSFVVDGQAITLPTAHARVDDQLYVHGAVANRMLRTLRAAGRASATFTLLDGLVLARTAFHHSMNFRSAIVFGPIHEVEDLDEKRMALHALIEHVAKGRMQELQTPTPSELASTQLLRLTIEEASAKQRSGPALDAPQDLALDVWAGEVPLELCALPPRRDARARPEQLISNAAKARAERHVPDIIERWHGDYLLSSDVSRIQFDYVHRFLSEQSYWAKGVSADRLRTSLANSLCFGLYRSGEQLGFARVVSDRARFAYLCDVFVDREHRAHGLGRALVAFALAHPAVRDADRCLLGTRDAHGLYETLGFERDAHGRFMERVRPR